MLLEEEEYPGDGCFLLPLIIAERVTGNVDVQPASSGLMAQVVHLTRLFDHLRPGHHVHVVGKAHRVADDLKAVFQAAVMLAVNVLVVRVANLQDIAGVVLGLTGAVDFQLDAEVAWAAAIEDRGGLEGIVVDRVAARGIATIAERPLFVFIFVLVVRVIAVENRSAAVAGDVIAVIAALAKRVAVIAVIALHVHAAAAVGANHGGFSEAVRAVFLFVEVAQVGKRVPAVAVAAGEGGVG